MKILPIAETADRIGICARQVYIEVSEGRFPKPVQVTARRVGWIDTEVDAWIAAKIVARDEQAS